MKKVFRYEANEVYWDCRWEEANQDRDGFEDLSIYPIRYAEEVVLSPKERVLELGAGLGRILKHYHNLGYQISGLERSEPAVRRLRRDDPELDIMEGDVQSLPYEDNEFDVVLAFGLYHNLEDGFHQALSETARCLKAKGRFCISMRPQNIEMTLNECYWRWKKRHLDQGPRQFHKWLVQESEFAQMLSEHGLRVSRTYCARNLSILHRVPWLRALSANESQNRARGYRLNPIGKGLDNLLVRAFPAQFCNVIVFIGTKNG